MQKTRLALIGGFLGAGKTTSIIRLAEMLKHKGISAGILTNDQGGELVDGRFVKAAGFNGRDVTGGCFCCNFNDMVGAMDRLVEEINPSILLSEPVGCCTDIIATVLLPLMRLHPDKFLPSPYSVVIDSLLVYNAIAGEGFPFSKEIYYLYIKQIEEADILLLNKMDLIEGEKAAVVQQYLATSFPDKLLIKISAENGEGMEEWLSFLTDGTSDAKALKEIDYGVYGRAEAMLGWYNASFQFKKNTVFDPNDFLGELLTGIIDDINANDGKIAHLKAIGDSTGGILKAGITANGQEALFSRRAYDLTLHIDLLLNARVQMAPDLLKEIINNRIMACNIKWGIEMVVGCEQCFKPSFPVPTHPRSEKLQCE